MCVGDGGTTGLPHKVVDRHIQPAPILVALPFSIHSCRGLPSVSSLIHLFSFASFMAGSMFPQCCCVCNGAEGRVAGRAGLTGCQTMLLTGTSSQQPYRSPSPYSIRSCKGSPSAALPTWKEETTRAVSRNPSFRKSRAFITGPAEMCVT